MRRTVAATAIAAGLLVTSTGPAAAAPPLTDVVDQILEDRDNPCTGQRTDLHLRGVQRVRVRETPSGAFQLTIGVNVTWTSTDGFAGHAKETTTVTARGDVEVVHTTLQFVGRDDAGRIVRHREQLHVRVRAGQPVVWIDHVGSSCHGVGHRQASAV